MQQHSRFSFIVKDPDDLKEQIEKGVIAEDPANPSAGCECETTSEIATKKSLANDTGSV